MTQNPAPVTPVVHASMWTTRSFQVFVMALAGLAAISCLIAFAGLSSSVGVPILSGIVLGFLGLQASPVPNP